MEKNYSFLKSYLMLFMLTLVSTAALAAVTPGTVEKILVQVPADVAIGKQVTFVDKANKVIYNGYQKATEYTTDLPSTQDCVTFTVQAGYKDGTLAFVTDPNATPLEYLDVDANLTKQDLMPEVSWTYDKTNSYVQSASTPNHYIYYDKILGYFKTTSQPTSVQFYMVAEAACPTFTAPAAPYSTTDAIWVETGKSRTVTVASATAGSTVYYKVVPDGTDESTIDWTAGTSSSEAVELGMNKYDDQTVTIYAKTVYEDGETSVVSKTYKVVLLNHATFTPEENPAYVNLAGQYWAGYSWTKDVDNVALTAAEGSTVFYDRTRNNPGSSTFVGTDLFDYYYVKFGNYPDIEGGSFKLKAVQEKGGFTCTDETTVSYKRLEFNPLGNLIADPRPGTVITEQGKTITFSYVNNQMTYNDLSGNTDVTTLTLTPTDGSAAVTVPVTWRGKFASFTVPSEFNEGTGVKAFNVAVPAKMFRIDSKQDSKTGFNTHYNGAETISYGQTYASTTWTINPWMNENPSDKLTADFDVYPVNGDTDVEVNFLDNGAENVRITDSENNDITASGVTVSKKSGTKNTFTVSFPETVVAKYLASSVAANAGFMVAFPENSLYTVGAATESKNKSEITGMIKFYEAVDIQFVANQKDTCDENLTEYPSYPVKVTGTGKVKHQDLTSEVTVQNAAVTIEGKDNAGTDVKVDATLSGSNGNFVVTPSAALRQGEYSIKIPANAFMASKTKESKDTVIPLKVYAHVTFVPQATETIPTDEYNKPYMAVTVVAHVEEGRTIEKAMKKAEKVTLDGKAVSISTSYVTDDSVAVVIFKPKSALTEGSHTVEFAAEALSANLDKSAALTSTKEAKKIDFVINPTEKGISTRTDSIHFFVTATFNGNNVVVSRKNSSTVFTTSTNAVTTETFNKDAQEFASKFDPITADDVLTYQSPTTNANKKGSFACADTLVVNGKKNDSYRNTVYAPDLTIKLTINPYITYAVEDTVYYVDTENESVTYKVYGKYDVAKSNGDEYVPAGTISYKEIAAATRSAETAAAFNNGYEPVYPTISEGTATTVKVNGVEIPATQFTATYGKGNVKANNYQMNFPNGTVYATANTNGEDGIDNRLIVNFRVMNHIEITNGDTVWAHKSETPLTIALKGFDTVDSADASNNVMVKDEAAVKYADGTAVTFVKNEKGNVQITAPATVGSYSIYFPAGSVVANASTNAKEDTVVVNVIDVVFAINDTTVNAYENNGSCKNIAFEVKAYSVDAEGNKTEINLDNFEGKMSSSTPSSLLGVNIKNRQGRGGKFTSLNTQFNNAKGTMFIAETGDYELDAAHSYYTISVPAGTLEGQIHGLVFPCEALSAKAYILNEFNFVNDIENGTKSTTNDELPATTHKCNVNYVQAFANPGQYEPIALPFDVPYSVIKDQATVYRVNFIYETTTNSQANFVLKELDDTCTMFANKPYVIASKGDSLIVTIEDVNLNKAQTSSIVCASTKTDYYFYNTYTVNATDKVKYPIHEVATCPAGKTLFYVADSDGTLKYRTKDGNMKIWRWYAKGEDKGINYAKFVVDGDFDATAVNNISADEFAGENVYNVAGMKLQKAGKGINIVNGHKYVK